MLAVSSLRAASASEHPLGNFTVNRNSRLELYSDAIRVRYVLDMAEIPTYQEKDAIDTNGDGETSALELNAYAQAKAAEIAHNIELTLNGERATPQPTAASVTFPEGQADLQTFRPTRGSRRRTRRPLRSPSTIATTTTPIASAGRSCLCVLPARSPRQRCPSAQGETLAAPREAPNRSGAGFASVINTDKITISVVLLALLAAFGFGGVHALEPAHGMSLGLIIAVTHTIGVMVIGLITLVGSQWILPERLYPWLSLASALMILGLGGVCPAYFVGVKGRARQADGLMLTVRALSQPSLPLF